MFEQNGVIPPKGDTRHGFDVYVFWNSCCAGWNKELFAVALSKSSEMKNAYDARVKRSLKRKAARAELSPPKYAKRH